MPDLKSLHDQYCRAIEATRAAEGGPAHVFRAASRRAQNARLALDEALIDSSAAADRLAMAEGRDAAARANFGGVAPHAAGPSREELRSFVTPGSPTTEVWVRPPREQVMGPAASFAKRDASAYLTTDTGTTGAGYFFTPELYRNVVTGLLESSGILEANPTLIVTNHLRPIQVPVLTADAVATAGVEGSPATATNSEGDAVTLGAFRFDGQFKVSLETIMAAEYNLEALLATFATRAIANKTAAMLALGAGTTEPTGLFTSSVVNVGVTTESTTAVTIDECLALTKALGKGYRRAAKFVASDVLHTAMLQAKSGEGDYTLGSVEGGGMTFAAKPLIAEPWGDQSGMSAGEVHGLYGDFAGYFVRTTPMFFRRTDGDDPLNPLYHFAIWLDARLVDESAIVSLVLHS